MKFIVEDKVYDIESSSEIISYEKAYPESWLGREIYVSRRTTLYRTKKGNWFSVDERNRVKFRAYRETEESVKKILKELDAVSIYNKYFTELEEA